MPAALVPLRLCYGLHPDKPALLRAGEPATTKLMFKRHKLERELGTGHEVGKVKPDKEKAREDKQLQELSKQFGMMHGMSTIIN